MIAIGKRTLLAKTCLVCGVLKMADQFGILKKYYRDSYCKSCHSAHSRPQIHAQQEKALSVAVKHRQPWTEAEIQHLERMVSEGLTGPQMALVLNRSVYAVYTMKNKLKASTK